MHADLGHSDFLVDAIYGGDTMVHAHVLFHFQDREGAPGESYGHFSLLEPCLQHEPGARTLAKEVPQATGNSYADQKNTVSMIEVPQGALQARPAAPEASTEEAVQANSSRALEQTANHQAETEPQHDDEQQHYKKAQRTPTESSAEQESKSEAQPTAAEASIEEADQANSSTAVEQTASHQAETEAQATTDGVAEQESKSEAQPTEPEASIEEADQANSSTAVEQTANHQAETEAQATTAGVAEQESKSEAQPTEPEASIEEAVQANSSRAVEQTANHQAETEAQHDEQHDEQQQEQSSSTPTESIAEQDNKDTAPTPGQEPQTEPAEDKELPTTKPASTQAKKSVKRTMKPRMKARRKTNAGICKVKGDDVVIDMNKFDKMPAAVRQWLKRQTDREEPSQKTTLFDLSAVVRTKRPTPQQPQCKTPEHPDQLQAAEPAKHGRQQGELAGQQQPASEQTTTEQSDHEQEAPATTHAESSELEAAHPESAGQQQPAPEQTTTEQSDHEQEAPATTHAAASEQTTTEQSDHEQRALATTRAESSELEATHPESAGQQQPAPEQTTTEQSDHEQEAPATTHAAASEQTTTEQSDHEQEAPATTHAKQPEQYQPQPATIHPEAADQQEQATANSQHAESQESFATTVKKRAPASVDDGNVKKSCTHSEVEEQSHAVQVVRLPSNIVQKLFFCAATGEAAEIIQCQKVRSDVKEICIAESGRGGHIVLKCQVQTRAINSYAELRTCSDFTQASNARKKALRNRLMNKNQQAFVWTLSDLKRMQTPLQAPMGIRSRSFAVAISSLESCKDIPLPEMSLKSTASYMIDMLSSEDLDKLKNLAQHLDGVTIRAGSTCSGSDTCMNVLRHTISSINERFGVPQPNNNVRKITNKKRFCLQLISF